MKLHGNARLSPKGRLLLCRRVLEDGWSLARAAKAAGVSDRTAGKWIGRYRAGGELGLVDRSSAPRCVPGRTDEARVELIATLRRLRMTGAEIAECLGMALSTRLRDSDSHRAGQALAPRASGAAQSLRAATPGGADPHRCQEAREDQRSRRRSPRHGPPQEPVQCRPQALGRDRLGVRARVRG